MPYNLASRSGILEPCDLANLASWFHRELGQVRTRAEKVVLETVAKDLEAFVRWPSQALLLWQGCNRTPEKGHRTKYHVYPEIVASRARGINVRLDGRANGPAIVAYLIAGGDRPDRFGSSNAWSIHHLYSGKFPYLGRIETMHAAKSGLHFTQSAGLVAAHPVADALADEFPFFAWLLRAHAFLLHGYDPDGVFSSRQDPLSFAVGRGCEVLTGDSASV